jgi:hypothetical protein
MVLLESERCAANTGVKKALPPDPLEPERSIDRESQGPINEGEAIFTTGREGLEGADKEIDSEGLDCQLSHAEVCDKL